MKELNPRVRNVTPRDDYTLSIEFSDGDRGVFDCAHLLDFGVFKELRDLQYFRRAYADGGTVAWPNDQDICPDTLYLESIRSTPEN